MDLVQRCSMVSSNRFCLWIQHECLPVRWRSLHSSSSAYTLCLYSMIELQNHCIVLVLPIVVLALIVLIVLLFFYSCYSRSSSFIPLLIHLYMVVFGLGYGFIHIWFYGPWALQVVRSFESISIILFMTIFMLHFLLYRTLGRDRDVFDIIVLYFKNIFPVLLYIGSFLIFEKGMT